jgi:uncharacterized protein
MTDRGSAAVSAVRAGPATDRVGAIDSARGLALLGIFLVNISFFTQPFGQVIMPGTQPGESLADQIVYYLTSVFCSGKFYAQFSMLFGIGLVLQMTRVESRGQRFVPLYLRRLAFLLALGFIHAIGIWYGDILFTYALAGLVLFFCRKLSGRVMVILSGLLFSLAILLSVVITFLMSLAPQPGNLENKAPAPAVAQATPASAPTTPPKEPTEWEKSPAGRLIEGFRSGKISAPQSELWMDLEREAYQNGPYVQAVVFRAIAWANFILYEIFGFFWSVLGLFFLGAGLFKLGLFEPRNIHWHRRFVWLGLFVGVPIATIAAFTTKFSDSMFVVGAINGIGIYLSGPLMGLMYIGLMTLAVHHGAARWLTGALANVGRMALTNYLMQSLIASYIFYWFGLGYFDRLPRTTCAAIVFGIFIGQIIFSNVWLSIFRIGPMEWLWRSFTYLSRPPLFREVPGKA